MRQTRLLVVRDSILYLARTLDIGYKNFAQSTGDPAQLWDKLPLEVHRHFQQAQIICFLAVGDALHQEKAGL